MADFAEDLDEDTLADAAVHRPQYDYGQAPARLATPKPAASTTAGGGANKKVASDTNSNDNNKTGNSTNTSSSSNNNSSNNIDFLTNTNNNFLIDADTPNSYTNFLSDTNTPNTRKILPDTPTNTTADAISGGSDGEGSDGSDPSRDDHVVVATYSSDIEIDDLPLSYIAQTSSSITAVRKDTATTTTGATAPATTTDTTTLTLLNKLQLHHDSKSKKISNSTIESSKEDTAAIIGTIADIPSTATISTIDSWLSDAGDQEAAGEPCDWSEFM